MYSFICNDRKEPFLKQTKFYLQIHKNKMIFVKFVYLNIYIYEFIKFYHQIKFSRLFKKLICDIKFS